MKKVFLAGFGFLLAFSLWGCSHSSDISPTSSQPADTNQIDPIESRVEILEKTNWDEMETVTVSMDEFSFSPSKLVFKAGVPYKLEIKNEGTAKHYFVSEEFFKAIATRKLQSNADGEIKAPYFLALEVFPGRSLDLYFVPVTKGVYGSLCTISGHESLGMSGEIVIE